QLEPREVGSVTGTRYERLEDGGPGRTRTYDQGIHSLRRFRREWTISSPANATSSRSVGCGMLEPVIKSAFERAVAAPLELSGSLCTFRRCTAGSAQGC